MRCRKCDYELWNLPGGKCPECGQDFSISSYRFKPDRVRFLCPHCHHAYPGQGQYGHLEPEEFDCAGCARHIFLGEMIVQPLGEEPSDAAMACVNPWIFPGKTTRFEAFFQTILTGLMEPGRLMDGTPRHTSGGMAMGFGSIIVALGFSILFWGWLLAASIGQPGEYISWSGPAGVFLFALPMMMILSLCYPLLTFALIRVTGPTQGGLDQTLKAMAYTSGPLLLCAVPFFGVVAALIALPWWFICCSAALIRVHQINVARAVVAVLLPPVFLVAAVGTLLGWSIPGPC